METFGSRLYRALWSLKCIQARLNAQAPAWDYYAIVSRAPDAHSFFANYRLIPAGELIPKSCITTLCGISRHLITKGIISSPGVIILPKLVFTRASVMPVTLHTVVTR